MCAAITAAQAGCEVLVLEHAPQHMRGGNSRHTRNLRVQHDQPCFTLTDQYTAQDYLEDLLRVTAGNTDRELAQLMIEQSEALLAWLVDLGVAFQPALRGTLNLSATNAFFLGGGRALLNTEYRVAERLGVQVLYDAEVAAVSVQHATRRAEAVTVRIGTVEHTIEAQAFVVASGGFQANDAWMREAWGPQADNFLIRGTPYNRGSVLKNLLDQGVQSVGDASQCHAVAIDARAPKYDGGIVSRLDCVCFSVVVNAHGQRFYDEGEDVWPKRYAIWGRLIAQQPEQIAYAIIDSQVTDNFMPSVLPPYSAHTLNELEEVLHLPAGSLTATLQAFNEAVQDGPYDPGRLDGRHTAGITPPKTNWALRLDEPPFFAYPLRPGITFTYLGLKVDRQARVHVDGKPISNLFAAGEVMAGNILGQGYCAGTGMTIGGVFGRIAGAQAAELR